MAAPTPRPSDAFEEDRLFADATDLGVESNVHLRLRGLLTLPQSGSEGAVDVSYALAELSASLEVFV